MEKTEFIENIINRFNPLSVSKKENLFIIILDDSSIIEMKIDNNSVKGEIISESGLNGEHFQNYFFSYSPSENNIEYLEELYNKIGDSDIQNNISDGTKLIVINKLTKEELIYDILFGYKKMNQKKKIEIIIVTKGKPINKETDDDFGPIMFKVLNNKVVFWDAWINDEFYNKMSKINSGEELVISMNYEDTSYIKLTTSEINELTYHRAFLR